MYILFKFKFVYFLIKESIAYRGYLNEILVPIAKEGGGR